MSVDTSMPAEMSGRKRLETMQELDRQWKDLGGGVGRDPVTGDKDYCREYGNYRRNFFY